MSEMFSSSDFQTDLIKERNNERKEKIPIPGKNFPE